MTQRDDETMTTVSGGVAIGTALLAGELAFDLGANFGIMAGTAILAGILAEVAVALAAHEER